MQTPRLFKHLSRRGDRGQLIPIAALSLVVLLGGSALAVDVGYWRYQQRLEQSAADSAAIAGAGEISFPASNDITTAAKGDAALNGFTDGANSTTVVVNHPPLSGPNQNNNAVEVIISKTQPTFFAGIFGTTGQNVSARAVAKLSTANSGCIYVLKGNVSGNLTLNGGGRGGITTTPLCGMVVNGDLTVTGQANVDVSYAAYAGNGPRGGSYPHGQPVHSVAGSDPCARLAGCAYLQTLKTTNAGLFSATCLDPGGVLPASPLPPGRYCGGPYSTTVTLQPGLFILDKGMFTGQVSGTGVTIYNNCSTNCNLTLSGGNVNNSIVAPTSGATAGMVYYQDKNLVNNITVNGAAGTVTAIGGVYAPGADFTFNGQLPTILLLIAGTITMNGGGLSAGPSPAFPGASNAVLAE